MANDAERLVVLLEARIKDFERNLQKASGTATRSYDRMRRGSTSATRGMEQDMIRSTSRINQALAASSARIGAYGKTVATGLVGGIVAAGITGVVREIRDMARGIATVGDEAKRAGVSARVFQEWKFVAEQNRIGVDQMIDGLKELNLRADEFVQTGKGPAAEAFLRLGYSAEELRTKLEDPSALLLEIIDRLGQMDKAAQIRIADEIFGGSAGERFVELLGQGEEGIRRTIDRAHELGIVMDDELIKKADELDRKFSEVASTVGTALKSAIVSAADSLAEFIEGFRAFEDQQSATLEKRQSDLMRQKAEIAAELRELESIPNTPANRNANRRRAVLTQQFNTLDSEENEVIGILADRTSTAGWGGPKDRQWTPPTPPPGGFGSKQPRDQIEETIEALEREAAQLSRTAREQEIYNALKRAGISDDHAMAGAVRDAAGALFDQETTLQRNAELMDEISSTAKDFASTFVNGLRQGKSAAESLGNAVDSLIDKLLDQAFTLLIRAILGFLMPGGGVALSGAGAPLFARGGRVRGPGTGTSDSIPAWLSDGEFVVNAAATRRHLPVLEAINDGSAPGFAAGGRVGGDNAGQQGHANGASSRPIINITNEAGRASETQQRGDGQIDIRLFDNAVSGLITSPNTKTSVALKSGGWRRPGVGS